MSGKPAARIDDKVAYARIVTGSRTVLIGSQGGVACSVCPGGVTKGNPVNPQLGAKVLSGAAELDFALPGAMPLVWQRQYSSYVNAEQGGYCSVFGYGWGAPFELRLSVLTSATMLHDSQGRTITFDALAAGESIYSPSEDIWLLRTGMHPGSLAQELAAMSGGARFTQPAEPGAPQASARTPASEARQAPAWLHGRFEWIGHDMACSSHTILAANGNGDTLWVFVPANWQAIEAARKALAAKETQSPSAALETELPAPSQHWILLGKLDRLGRMQRYHWANILGQPRISGIEDGVGRHYQLHYTQALAAQDAQYYRHPDGGQDGKGGHFFWQADSGVRLARVDLTRDPTDPAPATQAAQPLTLVSYTYSKEGDLAEVRDRHGKVTRRFAWRGHLMVLHQEASGPEHRYAYDRYEPGGRAIEQHNQAGIDYRFDYQALPELDGQPRKACVVTDSLGRVETYLFQGEAGLSRLVEHTRADGSTIKRSYNQYGHLTSVTDPLGRSTHMRVSPMGQLLSSQGPDGSTSSQSYDDTTGLLQSATDAAGRTTGYEYDKHRRLTRITLADGSAEHYHYPEISGGAGESTASAGTAADPANRLNADKPVRITDAKGGHKHIAYTRSGQTASYTDCSGHSTRYEYTRWGQTLAHTNALGERTRYQYNAKDQLQAVHYPDGSSEHYQYDGRGQVSQVLASKAASEGSATSAPTPAATSTTAAAVSMEYDLWGRLTRRSHAGASLGFAYDAAGRLVQLTNENGEHTTFAWDVMDRLTRETGFDARVQSYQYDAAGQLAESADGWAAEQSLPEHSSRYEWTITGQLAARHLPQSELTPATTHRYEWGQTGELLQASVWHHSEGQAPSLQSQALIERDSAGRVIGEVQRLYKQQHQQSALGQYQDSEPQIEFEHRISHRLDALGNREASQLHGLGEVGYLLYGSGHVHGITWQGESVVDLERDALHRDTKRQLATTAAQPLMRQLSWDSAGRLSAMRWSGLEQGATQPDMLDTLPAAAAGSHSIAHPARPPQALVGALASKHYHYDSLGQMIGIQSPTGMSRFAYDAAGRLTAADTPQAGLQRWRFDPAGNRLPITGPSTAPTASEAITGELNDIDRLRAQQRASSQANPVSQEQMARSDYNPLQGEPEQAGRVPLHATQKWAGNRVAYYENSQDASSAGSRIHYRYDSRGNRIRSYDERSDRAMELDYDSGNQLVRVLVHEGGLQHSQSYRYDAFGRRLAKYNDPGNSAAAKESGTDYFGWDGDRLVHTERFNSTNAKNDDGAAQAEIIHTVYEPGSFTPLVQLRQTSKPAPGIAEELLSHIPPGLVQESLRSTLANFESTAAQISERLGQVGMAADAQSFIQAQLQQLGQMLQEQKQRTSQSVEIRYYLCDHLGTPHALLNHEGQMEWAAQLDAWGNVQREYNPKRRYQPIRLPGQHEDRETALFYNRYRYYHPASAEYISQDPIKTMSGDLNFYSYSSGNPVSNTDKLGLATDGRPLNQDNCDSLQILLDYEKENGKLQTAIKYNPLNFSYEFVSLDAAYPSLGGPVSIDWMLRSGMGGLSRDNLDAKTAYSLGKMLNNAIHLNNPFTNFWGEANSNAPHAYTYWMNNEITLEELFAPSVAECKCKKLN